MDSSVPLPSSPTVPVSEFDVPKPEPADTATPTPATTDDPDSIAADVLADLLVNVTNPPFDDADSLFSPKVGEVSPIHETEADRKVSNDRSSGTPAAALPESASAADSQVAAASVSTATTLSLDHDASSATLSRLSLREEPPAKLSFAALVGQKPERFSKPRSSPTTPESPGPSSSRQVDPSPPKRTRQQPPSQTPGSEPGIHPQPAVDVHQDRTPANYRSRYEGQHPWAHYVTERPPLSNVTEDTVTSEMVPTVYRHLSQSGYFATRFVRSLFPRRFVGSPSPRNRIPIPELMRMGDAIAFRRQADRIIDELRNHRYVDVEPANPRTPPGIPRTAVCPPEINGVRPALYQVVSKGYGQGAVLEAKDFFVPCPDHMELHCIVLDQYSVNVLAQTRGFDRTQLSVKDLVWVLSLRPTQRAREDPENTLQQARKPRATAMDTTLPYFFRAREFILVTPPRDNRIVLGIVLSVPRRGPEGNLVNNIRVAFEGSKEAVIISPRVCEFPIDEAVNDQLLFAEIRCNSSCAVRFSQPPVSKEAQRFLVNAVRGVLPAYPDDGLLPLRVYRLTPAEEDWVADREDTFHNYARNPPEARRRMGKIFGAACAVLSSTTHIADDKSTRPVTAVVASLDSSPVRLRFSLRDVSAENGWSTHRPADVWFVNSTLLARMVIAEAVFSFESRTLSVTLHSTISCHQAVRRIIERQGWIQDAAVRVRICVRLARPPVSSDPLFALLAEENIFGTADLDLPCAANAILRELYMGTARQQPPVPLHLQQPPPPMSNGWSTHRSADVWFVNSTLLARMVIAEAVFSFESRTLSVTLHSTISCHQAVRRIIERQGWIQDAAVRVRICVRLARPPVSSDPLFALLAEENIFGTADLDLPCAANAILRELYMGTARQQPPVPLHLQQPPPPMSEACADEKRSEDEEKERRRRPGAAAAITSPPSPTRSTAPERQD
ncbi:unnamed protein product [Heligmosomoides polygyrus]|uniref:AAA_12 domain-containing protein n=1 Tax=Heligmosomoides polygyrus TaxID=6339 RepID=A0A183GTP5_HELPZ|nr:unnamed protein product [Heligmosomoides polygyrus]